MTVKDAWYHQAAITYNEELAEHAEELSSRLNHPVISKWCDSVAKQHRFHLSRHRKALAKLERMQDGSTVETEDGGEDLVISEKTIADEQAEFAAQHDDAGEVVIHRSAKSGKFVTEEQAEAHPNTTVSETVDVTPDNGVEEGESTNG